MTGVQSNLPVLLFVIPFAAALIAAAVGWIIPRSARVIALLALGATVTIALVAIPRVLEAGSLRTHLGGWAPPFGIELVLDPLSAFMAALVSVVAFAVVAGSDALVRRELPGRATAYYACSLLVIGGLIGMVVTNDLFNLFVQLEVASLGAYALVASGGRGAPRAGLTYLILGSFGASLYLTGVAFLYGATGSLNMSDVASLIPQSDQRMVFVAGLLIVAGLGIKAALFPLHTWMPGAYAQAPAAAAALMAPLVTKVSAYALLRIMFWVLGGGTLSGSPLLFDLLAWSGAFAMIVAGVLAFLQQNLRRLLAYSSIGQMGVIAAGIGLASAPGFTGAVLHLANDALMKGALFLAAGIAFVRYGVSDVRQLHLLRGRAPWTSAAVAVAGLSLVGVPPLSGFFGKWYVLTGAVEAGRWALVAAIAIGSLATVGYVFRIIEQLFFRAPARHDEAEDRSARAVPTVAACVALAGAVILLGLGNARVVSFLVTPALPALPGVAP